MKYSYNVKIKRHPRRGGNSYTKVYTHETEDNSESALNMLSAINDRIVTEGEDTPIAYDCGCMQKKCGACAMVINGRPMLACNAKLSELGENIEIAPLGKFPVVEDLIVDRSAVFEALKEVSAWLSDERDAKYSDFDIEYEASRCMQCGCCLEVCPNFAVGDKFHGMAAAVPMSRLISQTVHDKVERMRLSKSYERNIYEGCGKSLACRKICPAGIDMERLLVNSNAVAVWKRHYKPLKRGETDEGKH